MLSNSPFQDENTLKRWVAGKIRNENKQVTEQTIIYFLNKVGTDMENITKELEKLFSYTMEKTDITKEDVDAICVTQIANHIFDMVNAVAEKQQKKALDFILRIACIKRAPLLRILFLMTRQYRMLISGKTFGK